MKGCSPSSAPASAPRSERTKAGRHTATGGHIGPAVRRCNFFVSAQAASMAFVPPPERSGPRWSPAGQRIDWCSALPLFQNLLPVLLRERSLIPVAHVKEAHEPLRENVAELLSGRALRVLVRFVLLLLHLTERSTPCRRRSRSKRKNQSSLYTSGKKRVDPAGVDDQRRAAHEDILTGVDEAQRVAHHRIVREVERAGIPVARPGRSVAAAPRTRPAARPDVVVQEEDPLPPDEPGEEQTQCSASCSGRCAGGASPR